MLCGTHSRVRIIPLLVGAIIVVWLGGATEADAKSDASLDRTAQRHLANGFQHFSLGQHSRAISEWTAAYDRYGSLGNLSGQIDALAKRAEAYQALGHYRQSIADLNLAIELARTTGADAREASLRGSLGNVLYLAGMPDEAKTELNACLGFARKSSDKSLEARTLNNLANVMTTERRWDAAETAYETSLALAEATGDASLNATVLVNSARLAIATESYRKADELLREGLEEIGRLPDKSRKAMALISAGRLLDDVDRQLQESRPDRLELIYNSFDQALSLSSDIGDARATSYALGYLGALYERQGRLPEALQLTRRALFGAEQIGATEIVYRWQWQIARLHRTEGKREQALGFYRQAVSALRSIRGDMVVGYRDPESSFQQTVGSMFLELVDLLLKQSEELRDSQLIQAHLMEARQTMELLKTAELEDYFRDDCVAALRAKIKPIDRLAAHTAAVYPILLPDRTELLLSLPNGMERVTVPIGAATMTAEIHAYRDKLETRITREHLRHGMRIYDWLIAPVESRLSEEGIDTLVFIPTGPLHMIPISALYDGSSYLIEKYAVAVTPGLTLVDPRPIREAKPRVLVSGLSKPVQGFSSLPYVASELDKVKDVFGGVVYRDEDFLSGNMARQLGSEPYTIVHIASHAKFGTSARDSFLLTFDGRMAVDDIENLIKLSQFRDEPVELLTLSACETAAGDERAALGLAGIAVKAGARSALASLWFINDEAASALVSNFYGHLKQRKVSKAEALRLAQLSLLADRRFRHPSFWSPYLLIGNWL